MSRNTRQFLKFLGFIAGWSLVGSAAIAVRIHPAVVGIVWLVGFVWGIGYIIAGPSDAKLLLVRWLQMMIGIGAIGGVIALFLS